MLRKHPLAKPFNLIFYAEKEEQKGFIDAIHSICPPTHRGERACTADCFNQLQKSLSQARRERRLVVSSCAQGCPYFVIFFPQKSGLPDYLIGFCDVDHDTPPQSLQRLDKTVLRPVRSHKFMALTEVESAADKISRLLPKLLNHQRSVLALKQTTHRIEAIQKLTRNVADCTDIDQAVAIVSEALVVLFNLPRIIIVVKKPGQMMQVHSTPGLDPNSFQLDRHRLLDYLDKSQGHPSVLPGDELTLSFPGLDTPSAYLIPIGRTASRLGVIAILDVDLHSRDRALIELLINTLAGLLENLGVREKHRQEEQFSNSLIAMISALTLTSSRQELFQQILEMSAELLSASSGSLMLLDETEGTLKIKAVKGMNPTLAKTMSVAFGEGIAGRVAKNGFPLLVNDIERDKRVGFRNRPRFKTKSFVSLPLQTDSRLIGVLNLADKQDGSNFSENDLNLAKTLTSHAISLFDRAEKLEKAEKYEKLAITDPLTGLYNRRFLEDRLQEEFSRSGRQHQSFCLILADLDNFKIYNDLCGHIAGDRVLRKTARLMRQSAREMDVVFRYGGEEFCIILPGTVKKEAVFVAERIRKMIEAESFPAESHLPLGRLTISIGIASSPADGVTVNELIHASDMALYQAKALGRNRVVLYEPILNGQAVPASQG